MAAAAAPFPRRRRVAHALAALSVLRSIAHTVQEASTTEIVTRSRPRRLIEAALFIGVWMAIGFVFHPDDNLYLVIGVPLTVMFQLVVRREPIEHLWVKDGAPIAPRVARIVGTIAALASVIVAVQLRGQASIGLWLVCLLLGAGAVVYAMRHADVHTFRDGFACAAIVLPLYVGVTHLILGTRISHQSWLFHYDRLVQDLLAYFCVTFVLEEVSFRGAIDSHVQHPGERHGLLSAIYVSVLWALWHLPLHPESIRSVLPTALAIQMPVGVVMSIFWRRSKNLAVPAFAHALVDAFRNAFYH